MSFESKVLQRCLFLWDALSKNNAYKYAIQSSQILKKSLKNKPLYSDE